MESIYKDWMDVAYKARNARKALDELSVSLGRTGTAKDVDSILVLQKKLRQHISVIDKRFEKIALKNGGLIAPCGYLAGRYAPGQCWHKFREILQ